MCRYYMRDILEWSHFGTLRMEADQVSLWERGKKRALDNGIKQSIVNGVITSLVKKALTIASTISSSDFVRLRSLGKYQLVFL